MTRFDTYTTLRNARHPLFIVILGAGLTLSACGDSEPDSLPDCKEVVIVEQPVEEEAEARVQAPEPALALDLRPDPRPEPIAEPRPTRKTEVRSSKADPDPEPELHSKLEVVDYAIATGIKKRVPEGVSDHFAADEGVLWAWIKVKNKLAPSQITMVWRHEGKVRSRLTLDVGISPSWRTWSRKSIGEKDTGKWTVDIFAPDGERLERIKFRVESPEKVEARVDHEPPTKLKGSI